MPSHTPDEHRSFCVDASPSSQAVPSAAFVSVEQTPFTHVPALLHGELAEQVTPAQGSTGFASDTNAATLFRTDSTSKPAEPKRSRRTIDLSMITYSGFAVNKP